MMKESFNQIKQGFTDFSENFGFPVLTLILTIAYLLGVGLSKLIISILGIKVIDKEKYSDSYWMNKKITKKDIRSYLKQY